MVGNILADILPYLGFEPSYTEEELSSADMATPYLINYGPSGGPEHAGSGRTGVPGGGHRHPPSSGRPPGAALPIPGGGTVVLYTEEGEKTTASVPYVIGKTGNEANRLILNAGFNIKIEGESLEHEGCVAVAQSIEGRGKRRDRHRDHRHL